MNFMDFFRKHKVGVAVFALAITVRLLLFTANLHAAHGDFIGTIRGADGYYEISKNLLNGNGYSFDNGPIFSPEPLRPPVWIFIMAIVAKMFGGSYVPVFILEVILGSFIPIIGMYLARRIVSGTLVPTVGFLLALDPYPVLLSFLTISETCFTFLFLVSLIFLFRYVDNQTTRNAVWYGVFLALAILVKPTVQFFPILVPLAFLIFFRKRLSFIFLKHLGAFLAVCLLILAPWVYRNYQEFGAFGLSAQPAYNLYAVLAPTVLSINNGTDYSNEFKKTQSVIDARGGVVNLTNSDFYIKKALQIFAGHKIALLKSVGISVVTFFTHDGMLTVLSYAGITLPNFLHKPALILLLTDPFELWRDILLYAGSPAIAIFFVRLLWVAVTFLFFAGLWLYLRREKFNVYAWAALAVVAYFALTTAVNGFGMNARFRVPVTVFIFTFAVHGFSVLWRAATAQLFFKHEKTVNHHSDL